LRPGLEAEVARSGLRNLSFIGNRSDVADVYAGLDIVALTSLNEGTPLSLIEAMAAGRTFVSTSVGGVVDLAGGVIEQKGGFNVCGHGVLAESGDAEGFARGLIYLAENEKLRSRLAEGGQAFAVSKYAKARLVDDIKALYRRLASEQRESD
jgi:glycosyltransferase involved in cell wall biosynthesis